MRVLFFAVLLVATGATAACRDRAATISDAGPATLAPQDLSAPKRPPALRAAHPATPALPDLPSLAQHEAPAEAPVVASAPDQPCRAVWTGSTTAALACAKTLFGAHGSDSGGAELLVPRALLARDPSVLPAIVDHRLDGTEGPVRNQGSAPACTAFATATAIDHALLRWSGGKAAASAMQIWSRYHSPVVEASLASNVGRPIGAEASWPFDVKEAVSWIACDDLPKAKGKAAPRCGVPVDDARVKKLEASPLGQLTEVEYLDVPASTTTLATKIAAGQDLVVGMELPTSFVPKGRAGARYVPHYTKSAGPDAGHALVLVGYVRLPHGTYFLAHNSWGAGWGDGGYAWLHEATLGAWTREIVALDAEPIARDPTARARRDPGTTACAAGLVPDSIRAVCTPPCPDGSPRHDGVCAVAGQCPASYVNLSGACVLAAPSAKGSDPKTGIAWSCGPGGCAYTIPHTIAATCTGTTCALSCPAPDFHVARLGGALVCIE